MYDIKTIQNKLRVHKDFIACIKGFDTERQEELLRWATTDIFFLANAVKSGHETSTVRLFMTIAKRTTKQTHFRLHYVNMSGGVASFFIHEDLMRFYGASHYTDMGSKHIAFSSSANGCNDPVSKIMQIVKDLTGVYERIYPIL